MTGGFSARALGWFDGIFGRPYGAELEKYKEHAEAAGRRAAHWWGEVGGALSAECDGLAARLKDSDEDEERLAKELEGLPRAESPDGRDAEHRADVEMKLGFARREQKDLHERLARARQQRKTAYQRARASTEHFRDYYEGLMRSYCAGNRRVPDGQSIPAVKLPPELQEPEYREDVAGQAVAALNSADASRPQPQG